MVNENSKELKEQRSLDDLAKSESSELLPENAIYVVLLGMGGLSYYLGTALSNHEFRQTMEKLIEYTSKTVM